MPRLGRVVVVALLVMAWADQAFAQASLGLAAAQNAGTIEPGRRLTFVCPATDGATGNVYGTDVYTAESPVCPAAIHAGILKPKQPGVVSLLIGTGAKGFTGSTRNGVTTRSYGAWPYSFTFLTDGAAGPITWRTTWSQIPRDFTQPVRVLCPPGGRLDGTVWGTEVYARDSTICVAAVHAGVITVEKGGEVEVKRVANAAPFMASERFAVKTAGWSAVPDAFSVTAAATALSAPALRDAATAQATRPPGAVIIAPSASPGATLLPGTPSTGTAREPARGGPVASAPRNSSSVTVTVRGIAVTVSWSPVLGASWYGVAGERETLWRRVDAPATTVTYYLPFGDYTFAVGAYFEPGPTSTAAAEWPRVTAKVVRPETQTQNAEFLQSLLEFERWRAELEQKGQVDSNLMDAIAKMVELRNQTNSTISDTGR